MSDDTGQQKNDGAGAVEGVSGAAAARAALDKATPVNPHDATVAPLVEAMASGLERVARTLAASRADGRRKKRLECNVVAETIMAETRMVQDRAGAVFVYNGMHWEEATDHLLRHMAKVADGEDTTRDRRGEIVDYIKASAHNSDLQWGRCGDTEVPFANGVLDVVSGAMRPHRPEDYLENVIPHAWTPAAKCELWLRTLDQWFPPDPDADGKPRQEVIALQEFFGYILLPHARLKKALVLLGPSDSGKSIVPVIMRKMVGERFCCTLGVDKMDDPQLCAVLVGKRLNTVTEISQNAMVSDGGFKTLISTEEAILINEKYKPAYEYTPHAKHVFVTNNLPQVNDRTKAVFNRLLMVIFKIVIAKDQQDVTLVDKLQGELPGIIVWAIEGARRLVERNGLFSDPEESRKEIASYMREMNPFIEFAEECLVEAPGEGVTLGNLTDRFNAWHRGSRKWAMKQVTRAARAAGFDIRSRRLGTGNNSVKALIDYTLRQEAVDREVSGQRGDDPPPPDDI